MQTEMLIDEIPETTPEREPRERGRSTDTLTGYLAEIARTPMLSREEEIAWARRLGEARDELTGLLAALPGGCRDYVLNGPRDDDDDFDHWPLQQLEAQYRRLLAHQGISGDEQVEPIVDAAKKLIRQLDQARDVLVRSNLRLVVHAVRRYFRNGRMDPDLIQDGNIGLMRAVEKFDPTKGVKFSTYAYWWIRQAAARARAEREGAMHVPENFNRNLRKVLKVAQDLEERLGREPTIAEVAAGTEMTERMVNKVLRIARGA